MSTKQLEKLSKKAEKDAETEKLKVKKVRCSVQCIRLCSSLSFQGLVLMIIQHQGGVIMCQRHRYNHADDATSISNIPCLGDSAKES